MRYPARQIPLPSLVLATFVMTFASCGPTATPTATPLPLTPTPRAVSFLSLDLPVIESADAASVVEVAQLDESNFRGSPSDLHWSEDGSLLAVATELSIHLYDSATLKERGLINFAHPISRVVFFSGGRDLVSSSWDGTVKRWDVIGGRELHTFSVEEDGAFKQDLSLDGHTLATASENGTFTLWDVARGEKLRSFINPLQVFSLALSPDGRILAAASFDGMRSTVKLWDVASGQEMQSLIPPLLVHELVFSPDGRTLALAVAADVQLWDVASGQELHTLIGRHHGGPVLSVAFSPDGRILASGWPDGTVKLWDSASGKELRTLGGHNVVWRAAFSPDGRILALLASEGAVRFWGVMP